MQGVREPSSQSRLQAFDGIAASTEAEVIASTPSVTSTPAPYYQALLLISGFMMIFQTIGINQTFGVFQEFYTSEESNVRDAVYQDALVSLVGTIGGGLTWAGGIYVNPLISRVKDVKILTLSGAVIMSLGLLLSSLSTKLWHLYLTQAILYGIGSSLIYFPIMSLTPLYFDRRRGAAMGVILSGNGVGGVVLAPALRALLNKVGIQWTLRILGFWNLAVCIPVACVIRKKQGFDNQRTRMNLSVVKQGTFVAQSLGAVLQAAGNIIPLYYLTTYSTSIMSYSSSTSSLLLALNNAVNSISRIAMGLAADHIGRQNTLIVSVAFSALSVLCLWLPSPSRAQFLAFVVLYGVYAGGYNALLPTTIGEIYGIQNYSSVNGAIYFLRGLGTMLGAPVAGAILGSHARSYTDMPVSSSSLVQKYGKVAMYDGVLLMGATVCVAYVRWLDARNKGGWIWKA